MSINFGNTKIDAPNSTWNTMGPNGVVYNNQRYNHMPITNNRYDYSHGNSTDNSTHNTNYNNSSHQSGGTTNNGVPGQSNPQIPPTGQTPAPIPSASPYGQGPPPQTGPSWPAYGSFPHPPPFMSGPQYGGYSNMGYGPAQAHHYNTQFQPQQQWGAPAQPMGYPQNNQPVPGGAPHSNNPHASYAQPSAPSSTLLPNSTPASTYLTPSQQSVPQSPPTEEEEESTPAS
ncbi:hypothetical protein BDN72DRAFT_844730 [Pluteus cervinus]|uniref:Uncharacterized protein n=1 Tax=Pluteus cervinus TaxID=181527 RepID=A0ACD3AL80_9AGAR|nr:hypothetical protein BDN72DRAFT_844730 [Pluteus cervinus]